MQGYLLVLLTTRNRNTVRDSQNEIGIPVRSTERYKLLHNDNPDNHIVLSLKFYSYWQLHVRAGLTINNF
jgi:hypothetical protein